MPERVYKQRIRRCRACPDFSRRRWFNDPELTHDGNFGGSTFGAGCCAVNRHMSYKQADSEPPDWCPLPIVEADDA